MNFKDKAIEAVVSGNKFQTYVRGFITKVEGGYDTAATAVAVEVEEFRREVQPWIDEATGDIKADRRKKVNNIINDTARILREITGYTLKCTSRKNHIYEAVTPAPRSLSPRLTPKPTVIKTVAESPADVPHEIQKKIWEQWLNDSPNTILAELAQRHTPEWIAQKALEMLKGEG